MYNYALYHLIVRIFLKNFKKKLLISTLLLLGFTVTHADVIKIPPIVVKSKAKKQPKVDEATTILSTLKKAIAKNKNAHQLSKEEEAKEILERLKESIPTSSHASVAKTEKKRVAKRVVKKQLHKKPKRKISKASPKKHLHKIKKKSKIKVVQKVAKRKPIAKDTVQKKIKPQKPSMQSTQPVGFVKTLGVVKASDVYEVNEMSMDKLEEISNDGVVDIPTATTDKLEELPFVQPLEVVEVTPPFEASEAKKYQLDKR